jgi:ubiquinone/menaquinone biosynthesis C-methylase UbiE
VEQNKIAQMWSQSAPYWERYRTVIRRMFAPVSQALIEDARIVRGNRVLDVGTGPGEPALTVANLVGPEGTVSGIDPSAEMIAAARRAAARDGIRNVNFEVTPADRLPFADTTFDAGVSRFAAMFFRSPVEGINEILRVLRPKGKVSFAVWYLADRNPYHYVFSRVVERFVAAAPAAPDAPDAFRFAASGKLLNILKQAGAKKASERMLRFNIEVPLSLEDFWTMRSEMSDKYRSSFSKLSAEQIQKIRAEVMEGLRQYATSEGVSFPAEVLIVRGERG